MSNSLDLGYEDREEEVPSGITKGEILASIALLTIREKEIERFIEQCDKELKELEQKDTQELN